MLELYRDNFLTLPPLWSGWSNLTFDWVTTLNAHFQYTLLIIWAPNTVINTDGFWLDILRVQKCCSAVLVCYLSLCCLSMVSKHSVHSDPWHHKGMSFPNNRSWLRMKISSISNTHPVQSYFSHPTGGIPEKQGNRIFQDCVSKMSLFCGTLGEKISDWAIKPKRNLNI